MFQSVLFSNKTSFYKTFYKSFYEYKTLHRRSADAKKIKLKEMLQMLLINKISACLNMSEQSK